MRLYKEDNPLRVYIDAPHTEVVGLITLITSKFYKETDYSKEDDLRSFIFIGEQGRPYFPAGLIHIIVSIAASAGIVVDIDFETEVMNYEEVIVSENLVEGITLRDYQKAGIEASLKYRKGLIQVPTGGGKTEMMAGVARYLVDNDEGHILVCVPTVHLLHQTRERLVNRGVPAEILGIYGDGYKVEKDKRVIVATVQTVSMRLLEDKDFIEWYRGILCLMMDECHHSAARTWFTIIETLHPEYNLGFSAEPYYGDQDHAIRDLILRGVTGPIIYRVPVSYLIKKGYLAQPYLVALETSYPGNIFGVTEWHIVNKNGIVNNLGRNNLIVESASKLIDLNKDPLILVSQIAHGVSISKELAKKGYKVAMMTGGSKVTIYDGNYAHSYTDREGEIKEKFQSGEIQAIIGTSVMDEGVDMPVISSVILAGGGASVLKLVQRIGRGLRPSKIDNTTIILDFKDAFNVVTRSHFKKRERALLSREVFSYHIKSPDEIPGLVEHFRSLHN